MDLVKTPDFAGRQPAKPDQKRSRFQKYYSSGSWQRLRKFVKARAKGLCELRITDRCLPDIPAIGKELHHLEPVAAGGEFFNARNVVWVCRACHLKAERDIKEGKKPKRIDTYEEDCKAIDKLLEQRNATA